MNDPGLDEPIAQAGSQVKEQTTGDNDGDDNMDEEEEETNFLLPAKWWYASTAFPLIAGTFGPMANAFSICALVENWRVKIPPGGTEEHGIDIADPKWLIAVNAISLVFALLANLSLLLNMARRLPFQYAQPITIIGFWCASILLIGLIGEASHGSNFHKGKPAQALTQAYYYAIFAAGLYQIISYMMCVTAWGAWRGHFSKEFKLTIAQRTLMLQTIAFLVYLLLGALVYSKIEGWEFLDSVYWADFTALTIGIGDDYTPETHLGRGLLFPFALGGIVILGLVVGSIRSLVLDRSKKKLSARMTEKMRQRVLKRIATVEKSSGKKGGKVTGLNKETAKVLTKEPSKDGTAEVQRRKAEFEAMRAVQDMAAQERKWFSLAVSTFAFAFLWTIGALVFWYTESGQDWSYFESFYFSYTTLLTIGYGDFEPQSNSGKPFFVFWSLLAIPTLTILISNMGDTVVKAVKELTIWLGEITVLPSDEGGIMDRFRYGIYKATKGHLMSAHLGPDTEINTEEEDEDFRNFQEMNPGLAKMPARPEKRHKHGLRNRKNHHKYDIEAAQRLETDFEEEEKEQEDEAKKRGDTIAEDDHHYRHILISQIRKVYEDVNAATPKKYTYAEWAFFLALLGEDENDSKFHRRAQTPTTKKNAGKPLTRIFKNSDPDSAAREKAEYENAGQRAGETMDGDDLTANQEGESITKWSWIGNRSPLMGEQSEPEWLLERLFQKLEESLRRQWKHSVQEGGHKEEREAARRGHGQEVREEMANEDNEPLAEAEKGGAKREGERDEDEGKEDAEGKRRESSEGTVDGKEYDDGKASSDRGMR